MRRRKTSWKQEKSPERARTTKKNGEGETRTTKKTRWKMKRKACRTVMKSDEGMERRGVNAGTLNAQNNQDKQKETRIKEKNGRQMQ